MECAFCGVYLNQEDVAAALLENDEPVIKCHHCNTKLKVALEIAECGSDE